MSNFLSPIRRFFVGFCKKRVEISPFSDSSRLDEKREQTGIEFDPKNEAEIFANVLIKTNPLVADEFRRLYEPIENLTGWHFGIFPSQIILWYKSIHREPMPNGVSIAGRWVFYVFWPLRHGSSDGHGTDNRIIARIEAEQMGTYIRRNSKLELAVDTLSLKFMGFCTANFQVLDHTIETEPFGRMFPNISRS